MTAPISDDDVEKIAQVVHAAIRAWQAVNGQRVSPEWAQATWEQDSTRAAVREAMADPTPGRTHDRWMAERAGEGWSYGPGRDAARKSNPAMVPFEELPLVERRKDFLLVALTQALTATDWRPPGGG